MHIGGDTRYPTDPNRHGSYGVSEVRVWNVARSQSELQGAMNNCLVGNETGLVFYNKISDNTGTTATSNIGDNADFSAGMTAGTDWITGPGTCDANCMVEMSQIVSVEVKEPTANTVVIDTCATEYTWAQNTTTYTVTGMYNDTIPNVAGCDSVITLDLTIAQVDINVTAAIPMLTADMTGAQYQWLDCGNSYAVISGETSQSYTATADGSYAVEISFGACIDTSACETIAGVGYNEFGSQLVTIYPNPTDGNLWVEIPNFNDFAIVRVLSLDGKQLITTVIKSNKEMISLEELSSGSYLIEIISNEEKFINKIRLF